MEKTFYIYDEKKDTDLPDGKYFWYHISYLDLFHLDYLEKRWKQVYGKRVTYSNYPEYSTIKNLIRNMRKITRKDSFYKLIQNEEFCLPFYNFNIQNTDHMQAIKRFLQNQKNNSLWFLKKGNEISFGGYDVFPLINNRKVIKNIRKFIKESNRYDKYASNHFTLQRGIRNPLLVDGKKFDIRTYGLIVFCKNKLEGIDCESYYYSKGLIRKSSRPYDKHRMSKENMLTNTTLHTQQVDDVSEYKDLTEILEEGHPLYRYYDRTREIWKKIFQRIRPKLDLGDHYGYHLVGLDLIIDKKTDRMYVLEINSSPAIYYPGNPKMEGLHKNMEYHMFQDFFDITLEAIRTRELVKQDTSGWFWIT